MYYVYKITNRVNGKIYVGKTKNPKVRWRKHLQIANNSNQNRPLYNSIRKHGANNFSFEVIETFNSEFDSFGGERKWIDYYRSNDLTVGMNLTNGGEGPSGMRHTDETKAHLSEVCSKFRHTEETKNFLREINIGKKLSEDTKQKISDSKLGARHTEEHKEKIRTTMKEASKGENNGFFGKKHSDETKEILSKSMCGQNSPRSKFTNKDVALIRNEYSLGKTTLKELSAKYGASITAIHQIVKYKHYFRV